MAPGEDSTGFPEARGKFLLDPDRVKYQNGAMKDLTPKFRTTALAVLLLMLGACSPTTYSVRHVMVPLLDSAREAAYLSDDIRTFGDAAPSNLFLLEGMVRTDPDNADLRLNAAMLYFFYGFAYIEQDDPDYASLLYRKGLDHAWYVVEGETDLPADRGGSFDEFEARVLSLQADQVPAAVWAATCWSQYISLHLDRTAVMRDIPKVQALIDRVIALDGNYFEGLPHVLQGSLHAFKPPMMGGDPEASAASFERAFAIAGNSFQLSRFFYARYYTYRMMDADLCEQTLQSIIEAEPIADDPYRLLNMIAVEKSLQLMDEIDDIF